MHILEFHKNHYKIFLHVPPLLSFIPKIEPKPAEYNTIGTFDNSLDQLS